MADKIQFTLNGKNVTANADETIWQAAKRLGEEIPHLCYKDAPGYRADGNCRACMVEIDGERTLAASCIRKPAPDMVVNTATERAKKNRELVFELLMADQPAQEVAHDNEADFWKWARAMDVSTSRFPSKDAEAGEVPSADNSHAAIAVNLDACINCGLCVRACREVQVNDVIGMASRGSNAKIVFDFDDHMGNSTCVGCGECVQACPTGALMENRLLNAEGVRTEFPDKQVDSGCPFCGVGCQITYDVKDDKIISADGRDGPANNNRLCVKGRFGFDYQAHPNRMTKPLIRRDDAPKAGDIQIADSDVMEYFREATWEEALDVAANGLAAAHDKFGKGGIAGFGSAKGSNEEAYLFQKLIRTRFETNNVDHCTRLCHASSVAALMESIGTGAVTAPFTAATDAEFIMVIGANPTVNHPVAATYIKQAAKKGAKLIICDPRKQGLSRHATEHMQFKPGGDVSMLNAMLHVIINEGLHNEEYIEKYTEGFEALRENLKDFSPEAMEPVCGIPAETLRKVARWYATSPAAIIFWGMGVSQHVHGTDNARCLIQLALVTGQVGKAGAGLHPLRGQNNVQGASDAGLIPMFYPDYKSVESEDIQARYREFWGKELDPKRGLTVVEIMDAIIADEIGGMFVMGENPAMSDPDQHHARAALAKLDFLVVQDIFLTETAWHADVIFPASAYYEKDGTFTNTNRQIQRGRQVVPCPGDARPDVEILIDLANALGMEWQYPKGAESVFEEMSQLMPSLNNISWSRIEREHAVTYPCDAPDAPGQDIIMTDGYPTASGKGKIVPAKLVAPDELPDTEYPMVLCTGRVLEHWHTGSMTRRATVLDAIEPEATAMVSPKQLDALGIQAGELIQVSTRRGNVELIARADRDVPEGMVFIPFCYAEAAANLLTNPKLDPFGKIPEFKFCAAKITTAPILVAAE